MRERPTVTVVIPCFDQARFLPAAVASVRAQRCAPGCLVVDDGSTDDTAAVATRLRVQLLRQTNAGVAVEGGELGVDGPRQQLVVGDAERPLSLIHI